MAPPDDPLAELRATFYTECDELLDAARAGLLAMREVPAKPEAIHTVFRAVHAIKGAAGAFALQDVVSYAHALETPLSDIRAGILPADNRTLALLQRACDGLGDLVAASRNGTSCDTRRIAALREELEACGPQRDADAPPDTDFQVTKLALDLHTEPSVLPAPPARPTTRRYRIDFAPTDAFHDLGQEPLFLLHALTRLDVLEIEADISALPDIASIRPGKACLCWTLHLTTDASEAEIREISGFVEDLCTLQVSPIVHGASASAACPPPNNCSPPSIRRVSKTKTRRPTALRADVNRIERLANLVGGLTIAETMLPQRLCDAGLTGVSEIAQNLERPAPHTREMQRSVLKISTHALKPLFHHMTSIVRQTPAATGKRARLITECDGTGIDAVLIERLCGPLTHMLRNAVDHGLEPPEARAGAGKPAEGTVQFSAAHRSGRVVIQLSDDGGGIDRREVQQTAIARGLLSVEAELSEAEIDRLLFLPGFSTARKTSALSGRGVGLDAVREAIRRLGGQIAIRSEKGQGTTFSISLPLSLAVLEGMIVETAGEKLVMPVRTLVETRQLSADDVGMRAPGGPVARIGGWLLPRVDLVAARGFRAPPERFVGLHAVVIAPQDDEHIALTVEAIGPRQQVVNKQLNSDIGPIRGISATTMLDDGQIALILDPRGIATRSGLMPQMSPAG